MENRSLLLNSRVSPFVPAPTQIEMAMYPQTDFPPVRNLLLSTNGNGSALKATDTSPGSRRFYRVRVAY